MPLEKRIKLARIEPELAADEIGDFIVQQVLCRCQVGGVIGLSGGVDSTTTAALAKRAFDRYNAACPDKPLELVGYILPSGTNSPDDERDGRKVAERLGIRYETHSIEPWVEAAKATNPEAVANKYDKGNLMSRIRGNILNTKAASERRLVLGTGNRDEDFVLGYYTLFGDGAVHISPIGNISKRLVRELARYLGFPDLADRVPTAGLEPGQTDFKDIGYSYDSAEVIIEGLLQGFSPDGLAVHSQVVPLVKRDLAAYARMYGRPKFGSAAEVIEDVARRNRIAKAKAEILHPPAAPLTLRYE